MRCHSPTELETTPSPVAAAAAGRALRALFEAHLAKETRRVFRPCPAPMCVANVGSMIGRGARRRLAGYRFAVPLAGRHVRRVFDERCPGR